MNRTTLIQGFCDFLPDAVAEKSSAWSLASASVPRQGWSRSGVLLYRPADHGRRRRRGSDPLSIGYAALMHMDQAALGRVLPMVMLAA